MNPFVKRLVRVALTAALMGVAGGLMQGCGPLPEDEGQDPAAAMTPGTDPATVETDGTAAAGGASGQRLPTEPAQPRPVNVADQIGQPRPLPPDGGAPGPAGQLHPPFPTR